MILECQRANVQQFNQLVYSVSGVPTGCTSCSIPFSQVLTAVCLTSTCCILLNSRTNARVSLMRPIFADYCNLLSDQLMLMSKFLFYSLLHFWHAQLSCSNLPLQQTNKHIRFFPKAGEIRRWLIGSSFQFVVQFRRIGGNSPL